MDKEKAIDLLLKSKYKFAKTAKHKNPHWYTLKRHWDENEFKNVVQFIRDNGIEEGFWKIKYKCFHYKGWKYWTMGAPIDETILINKTYVSEQYNKIAYKYDELFLDPESKKQDVEIFQLLKPHIKNKKILDIGSGTGLLVNILKPDPENYIGIDPSYIMIKLAKKKFPNYNFKCNKLETYHKPADIAISLYGSMNYVIDDYIDKVIMLAPKHFLVFYKNDYNPEVYERAEKTLYHYKYCTTALKSIFPTSDVKEWYNYIIVSNL
jgi:SAM-dependent methyltransferase